MGVVVWVGLPVVGRGRRSVSLFLSLPSLLFPSPVSSSSPRLPFRSALSPAPLPLSRLARSLGCACRLSVGWLRGLLVVGLCSPPPCLFAAAVEVGLLGDLRAL